MKTISVLAFSAFAIATGSKADYAMPPISEVVKSVPIIVDATVSAEEERTGAVILEIHRVIRGEIKGKFLRVSNVMLTCTGGGPATYGAAAGSRYVFLLHAPDTMYEESTFYPVIAVGDDEGSWRVRFPHPKKTAFTADEFSKLLEP